MGFSLQISSLSEMVSSEEDERLLLEFLERNNIQFRDRFDPAAFQDDFFEVDMLEDDDEAPREAAYVAHPEVGWSWWSATQLFVAGRLGEDRVPHTLGIHAWYGVAVPGDVEPTLLGPPRERAEPAPRKPGLLERLGLKKAPRFDPQQLMDVMVSAYSGGYRNLHVVSAPRLLAELDEAARTAGLESADPMELYEAAVDDDEEMIAQCYLVMVRKFLRAGLDQQHLVWWRK